MPQPYQYFPQGLPDPTAGIRQIFDVAQGVQRFRAGQQQLQAQQAQQQLKQQQLQAAQQQQQQFQGDIDALGEKPSAGGIANLILKYPQHQKAFTASYDILSADEKKMQLNQASQVYSAVMSGNTDMAKELLAQQAEAYRNEGNESEAKEREDLAKLIDLQPKTAIGATGMFLASAMGPEEFTKIYGKIGEERRAEELRPLEVAAKELGISAKKLEIKKKQAEIGKLADKAPAIKDPTSGRKEFTALSKDFITSRDAQNRVEASAKDPSAAGDLSLIFNFMKVLDPGSVVREGEFATAQNAAGVPERIRGQFNRVFSGERLTDKQRTDFLTRSRKLFGAATKSQRKLANEYTKLSKKSNIDPEDVVIDFTSVSAVEGDGTETKETAVEAVARRSGEAKQGQAGAAVTKTVLETRTLPDGRTIVKFSDGTMGFQ